MKEYSIKEYELVDILDYSVDVTFKKGVNTVSFITSTYNYIAILGENLYLIDIDLHLKLLNDYNVTNLIIVPFHSRIEIYEKKNN